jgi:hypothetical protein
MNLKYPMLKLSFIFGITSFLMACQFNEHSAHMSEDKPNNEQASESCAVLQDGKWHAWIDRYSDKQAFRLNLVGEVILPNPGYTIDWRIGPTDRRAPPAIRIQLLTTPASHPSIQVLTPIKAEFSMETAIQSFRSVSIYCGDKLLIEIPDVQLTD